VYIQIKLNLNQLVYENVRTHQQSVFKRYHSDKHFSEFTYKMAAKINWHRYGTKLRHCHLMYMLRKITLSHWCKLLRRHDQKPTVKDNLVVLLHCCLHRPISMYSRRISARTFWTLFILSLNSLDVAFNILQIAYMKMDRKPKNIMLKAYDYSVMFFFTKNDFTSRVTSPVMCRLQRIGIWRFEAAIRTIIIIVSLVPYL